ncbi:hypothetical protein DESA109040_07525 [Deinococcus saxicola]|uniref:hypothetical protein n=1 Tax=Deinococcus saxicola TaxID=249406 RepID=UPI0039F07A97
MDRELFDRVRNTVQDELKNAGQDIEIPDPDSSDYFNTFLALQRTHPRLAARLAEAGQADPAQVLDPYTPRPSKITAKHRWNSFVDKNFMRRGIDRKLVLDRQRVFRTGMYTLGGIVVAGLVWSVVAPKPAVAADLVASSASTEQTIPGKAPATGGAQPLSTDTSGAFTAVSGDGTGAGGSPPAEAASTTSPPKPEDQPFASDTPPQPVTTATGNTDNATPPPPAVFNQVPQNDPYAPVASPPQPPPASPSYADDAPASIAVAPAMRAEPFGGTDSTVEPVQAPEARQNAAPVPVSSNSVPVEMNSPFASAPEEISVPGGSEIAPPDAAPTPAVPSAPFGGETATATSSPAPQAVQTPAQDQPARGAAMLYQAQRQEQPLPKSSLMYQRPTEQKSKPSSAMIYQAQGGKGGSDLALADGGRTGDEGSLTYQRAVSTGGGSAGGGKGTGGSLLYQGQPKSPVAPGQGAGQAGAEAAPTAAFAQTPDPDAPKFAPTSVIQGKLFSNIRTAAGLAVPVIVVSGDGNWVGVATYNTPLGRVDMRFTSFVMNKNGKSYPVDASAYQKGQNGTISEGVGASIHPIAPTLAVDLARAGINSLNTYTRALQNSGTTSVNGSLITTARQAPELVQVVRGEIGKVFALPEGNVSIRIVADVAAGTDVQVVYGVSGVPADQ